VHNDQLGTPRKITQPSDNALLWRWDPDTFGSASPNQNPAGLGAFTYNLRFPGQYYLAESGLHYNYYRDYDPQTGRYVESDPIGLHGGLNTYAYA
jgi:RHS repeat-associated protein